MFQELANQLKVTLATAFSFYLKSHNFHWNVTGTDFAQYHNFLGELYEKVHDSIDLYAEHIRTLDVYVPGSYTRFASLTKIADEVNVLPAEEMFKVLYADNEILLSELRNARDLAEQSGKYGIVNFLEGQLDFHDKMHWMLRSFSVKVVAQPK